MCSADVSPKKPLRFVLTGSATMGVLIVNGGVTVVAADTLGSETRGILGGFAENCVIC